MRLLFLVLIIVLSSCRVVKHTTDKSNTSVDITQSSSIAESIISHLKDSSSISIDIDSVLVVIEHDSISNDAPKVIITASGISLNGSRTSEQSIEDTVLKNDTSYITLEEQKDIVEDIDKTYVSQPLNLTLIITIVMIVVILVISYLLWRKLS